MYIIITQQSGATEIVTRRVTLRVADYSVPVGINEETLHGAAEKSPPADADEMALLDSASASPFSLKKITWANVKAFFDALYAPIAKGVTNGDSHNHSALYAPIAKGVTDGDNHNHSAWDGGAGGGQIDHARLSNIGTNTHTQVDTHIANINKHGYAIQVGCASFNPADSATLYFGAFFSEAPLTTILAPVYPQITGTINKIRILWRADVAGSADDISIYIQADNNPATDVLIQTVGLATTQKSFVTTSANFTWTNYFVIKIVCPAWTTNPTNVRLSGSVFIES